MDPCRDKSEVDLVVISSACRDKFLLVMTSVVLLCNLLSFACFLSKLLAFHYNSYKTNGDVIYHKFS